MMKTRMKKLLLIIGTLLMIAVNGLASSTQKLGFALKDLYQFFPFDFMPPAWAFMASRGLIYLLGITFLIAYLREREKEEKAEWSQNFFPFYLGIIVLNIAWIFATTQKMWILSVIILIGMLCTLISILKKLKQKTGLLKLLGDAARGIYLGRIIVATVVLGISQVVWTLGYQSIADSLPRMIGLSGGMLLCSGLSFFSLRNWYALIWSLLALGSAWFAFLG